jgi:hypothetical protein
LPNNGGLRVVSKKSVSGEKSCFPGSFCAIARNHDGASCVFRPQLRSELTEIP